MAYKITTSWTRPSLDVNFFKAPAGLKQLNVPYLQSGDLIMEFELSTDGKMLTQTSTFKTKEVLDAFVADTARIAYMQERTNYNDANGIVIAGRTETEV